VTLIGSRLDCNLPVNDPRVSKVHAALVHTGHSLLICDLCSRGGTFRNGQPVHVATLRAGDVLHVGPAQITVESLALTPDDAAGAPSECPPGTPPPFPLKLGGHTLDLTSGTVILGRRSTCEIILDTPDASLAHALVFAYQGRPFVYDLGSRSGTFVNGRRIQLAPLHDGDCLTVGGERHVVECATAPAADPGDPLPTIAADVANEPAPSRPVHAAVERDARAREQRSKAERADVSAARRQIEEHTLELDHRAAELDTQATLLAREAEQIEQMKAELARREAKIEQLDKEARERLDLAVAHEQAVTAAWQELDRYHATRSPRAKGHTSADAKPAPAPKGDEPVAFTNEAQPYPPPEPGVPKTPSTGSV
jgi:pSer/pThr/pTyr-binding forkhead associated (FHA) protein